MSHRLFINSSTGVDIDPEYDYANGRQKIESVDRPPAGSQYRYLWGSFGRISMGVMYVDSATMSIVNSWWDTSADLLWMKVGDTAVYSVHLTNKKSPITKNHKPYDSLFKGTIELETY